MTEIETQINAVRNGIGLIDRSDVGIIAISGEDRFTWLQGMVSNDVRLLEGNGIQSLPACILDATGHIVSDLVLMGVRDDSQMAGFLNVGDEEFLLAELPSATVGRVADLLNRFIILEDVEVTDVSDRLACISLQGLKRSEFWNVVRENIAPYIFAWADNTDHTGSGGSDYFTLQAHREVVLSTLLAAGAVAIGVEAQEILRVEAGIPKYGVDMDESTLAPEAGLMATHISLTKGCYVGQEIIARIHSRGHTNRALTGLVFAEGDAPTSGDNIIVEEDGNTRETGRITSVIAASPALNGRPIALGYLRHEHRAPGNQVQVIGRDRTRLASVTELPFYWGSSQ